MSTLLSNSTGAPYLDGTLTAAAFLGAPLVAIGDDLNTSDPRWEALESFADALGAVLSTSAPLVGFDTADGSNFAALVTALLRTSKFYAPDATRPLAWSGGAGVYFYPVAGPILSMPSSQATRANNLLLCQGVSGHYVRTRSNNLYGVGLFACGPDVDPDTRITPPVYDVPPTLLSNPYRSPTLLQLVNVWRRGGPAPLANYETLATLEATRPGISFRTHPALVPYLKLS